MSPRTFAVPLLSLLILAIIFAGTPAAPIAVKAQGNKKVHEYQPKGMYSWDYWFAVDSDNKVYHAFYLQYPLDADPKRRHGYQWIGHAISKDLRQWETVEDALRPIPNTFNDRGLATGSVVRDDNGVWVMLYTSGGTNAHGFATAICKDQDARKWTKLPESLIPSSNTYRAEWKGELLTLRPLADPYIHPEKIGGLWYLTINSFVLPLPNGKQQGGVLMMKSKDLRKWQPHKVVAWPGPNRFDRCETTQTWEHSGKWYLSFGGAGTGKNMVYMSDRFDGPYEEYSWSELKLPDGQYFYIGKQVRSFEGKDYFLAGIGYARLSQPYPIKYDPNGKITLLPLGMEKK